MKEIRGNPLESDVGMLPSWSSRINTSKALIMGGKVVPFAGHRTMFVADLLSHIGHNVTTLQYVRLFGTSTTPLFSINLISYLSGSTWQCRLAVTLVKLQSKTVYEWGLMNSRILWLRWSHLGEGNSLYLDQNHTQKKTHSDIRIFSSLSTLFWTARLSKLRRICFMQRIL